MLFFESLLFYVSTHSVGVLVTQNAMDIPLANDKTPLSTLDLVTYSLQQVVSTKSLLPKSQLRPPGHLYLQTVYDQ